MAVSYRCPKCGSQDGLYIRADMRWDPAAYEWSVVRDSIGEDEVDCTECDYLGPIAKFELDDDCPEELEHTNRGL